MSRKEFLGRIGVLGSSFTLLNSCTFLSSSDNEVLSSNVKGVSIGALREEEDIFSYIQRVKGEMDLTLYQQLIGAANAFKEGDQAQGLTAIDGASRERARMLLSNTKIAHLEANSLFADELFHLIRKTTVPHPDLQQWTMGDLKGFILSAPEEDIKKKMPALCSDIIACLVKLMSNEELIQVGQKVFNPLPNSKIGSKGYLSARVQPNSPTDHADDILWQVFDAWSFAVGDLVLGTNPVSSETESVARVEECLYDIISTFQLEDTLPNCVLSHIDVQAEVEYLQPGTTGIWFQSLAGTVNANTTFDISIDKMFHHVAQRNGRYGLYAETGQGADFTNGHGENFDMVVHESRKYGFLRALKLKMDTSKHDSDKPWVHVNDVAGFIGPEVFKTKEQLVRCCLEDTVMGKLHGLCIGLDICSTLHMDVSLEDLDWCIEQVMPANPAYLMALPTKNDPMLSYLTTSFSNHLKIRKQFGYCVNDAMWDFFKKLQVIDEKGLPTSHFGDPIWVYYQYCLAKSDSRSQEAIYREGKKKIQEIRDRGVPIAEGHGEHFWDLAPDLDREVTRLYKDAKVSLWTALDNSFLQSIPDPVAIRSTSRDRKDYVYHPSSGERLSTTAISTLRNLRQTWQGSIPDVQIIISDGLNARALMDEGHLFPFLEELKNKLNKEAYTVSPRNIVITHGRVRAGYVCGELLFAQEKPSSAPKAIVHIIGERPGSGHHNFSAYLTVAPIRKWSEKGRVDHNITKVVSGISDTALLPTLAVSDATKILGELFSALS